jgi:hypothetical protein
VSFRAARSELEAFDLEWMSRGYRGRSQALKALVRARCGVLDVTADQLAGFVEVWRQSRDLTDVGMALAKAVRRGRLVLTAEDRALVSNLVDLAHQMTRELGAVKDRAQAHRWNELPDVRKTTGDEAEGPHG